MAARRIIIFDGVCSLCNTVVKVVTRNDPKGAIKVRKTLQLNLYFVALSALRPCVRLFRLGVFSIPRLSPSLCTSVRVCVTHSTVPCVCRVYCVCLTVSLSPSVCVSVSAVGLATHPPCATCGRQFCAMQSKAAQPLLKEFSITMEDASKSFVFVQGPNAYRASTAAMQIARHMSFPFPLLAVGYLIPRVLRDYLYYTVANNRYKWFGKTTDEGADASGTCLMPRPDIVRRFLDADEVFPSKVVAKARAAYGDEMPPAPAGMAQ